MEPYDRYKHQVSVKGEGYARFGASTPEGVAWLETVFPGGFWEDDEDGRPWYVVTGIQRA